VIFNVDIPKKNSYLSYNHTVNGRNPAPVGIWFIPLEYRYSPTAAVFLPSTVNVSRMTAST
jgi:hypothetical protein